MINRNTPLEDLPELMTPQEIADYMELDRWTVYQMMKIPRDKGGIPNFPLSDAKNASKRTVKRDFIHWIEQKSQRREQYA